MSDQLVRVEKHEAVTLLTLGRPQALRNFLLALPTSDVTEGVAAFTERRTPRFTGK